ncbi:MAG: LamG-like jellyroll fold domain-containing protein [Bacteroidota bacterium]
MKKSLFSLLTILIAMFLMVRLHSAFGQFDSLATLAHYPLFTDGDDHTGINDSMTLMKAPYNRGIYATGIYLHNFLDPPLNPSHAITPVLAGLNIHSFRVSFRFRTHVYQHAPILMGGHSFRWIGAYLEADSTFKMKYNNSHLASSTSKYKLNTWYEIVLTYDGTEGKMFVDGTEIISQPYVIEYGYDPNFGITDFSTGETFKGEIQSIRVYKAATGGNLAAYYPLEFDVKDSNDVQADMVLTNTPFIGGIYSNGRYINGGLSGASQAITPQLDSMNMNSFAINFRFKAAEIEHRPVLVGGNSLRWMGLYIMENRSISLKYNNSDFSHSSFTYQPGDWHRVSMTYDGNLGKVYIDGEKIIEEAFVLNHGNNKNIGTTDFSVGKAFRGMIQDLQIFDADTLGELIAHYPLLQDEEDATGNHGNMLLTNTPFIGGVCTNGTYLVSGIETPNITGFNFDRFSISGLFHTPVAIEQPVLVGGNSFRWLGLYLRSDSSLAIKYNNSNIETCPAKYLPHEWHHFQLSYDVDSQKAWLFLDFEQVCSVSFDLMHGGDANVSSFDYATGDAFWGCLQDLTISEGTGPTSDGIADLLPEHAFRIFPNPAHTSLNIELEEVFDNQANLAIYTMQGQEVLHQSMDGFQQTIHVEDWPDGTYVVMITMEDGRRQGKRFVKQ